MEELTDLLKCIAQFDKNETLKNKGKYFEIIQKDAKRLVKLLDLHDVIKSVCDHRYHNINGRYMLYEGWCEKCGTVV